DAVLAGEPPTVPEATAIGALRLGIPQTLMLDDLEPAVAGAFERATAALSRAGARVVELPLKALGEYATINAKGGFSPCEAYAWHEPHLKRRGQEYDQRVRVRIERGREVTAVDYIRLLDQRADLIARVDRESADVDALIMPTLPLVAPPIAAFAKDEEFWRLNARILRNTAPINFLDRCAITIPISPRGEGQVGLTAVGRHGDDRRLLALALGIEAVVERECRS
ncbi:MAG: amidase family protein, partial [Stellaceae bacterium]